MPGEGYMFKQVWKGFGALVTLALVCSPVHAATYGRIDPTTDVTYLGAFRVPSSLTSNHMGWGQGLTFYPGGNGGKGSLYITQGIYAASITDAYGAAEFSIPTPVNSKNLGSLKTATLLQPWTRILTMGNCDDTVGGLAYMAKTGGQTTDKLYWGVFEFYGADYCDYPSLGMSELNLSTPNSQGPFHVGASGTQLTNKTGKYLLEADHAWSDLYTGSKYLLVGRLREAGGQGSSMGPTLYAVAPWAAGNPPPSGANLPQVTLLEYPPDSQGFSATNFPTFSTMDHWSGAVWIKAGTKHAVLFTGGRGQPAAQYCYGTGGSGGQCNDPCNSDKGYHNYPYFPGWAWYDVTDLAAVAQGTKQPGDPIPYSFWTPTSITWDTGSCAGGHVAGYGGAAYDSVNNKLYVVELNQDGTGPIIHVFHVNGGAAASPPSPPQRLRVQ
jgi:hypothetical protein